MIFVAKIDALGYGCQTQKMNCEHDTNLCFEKQSVISNNMSCMPGQIVNFPAKFCFCKQPIDGTSEYVLNKFCNYRLFTPFIGWLDSSDGCILHGPSPSCEQVTCRRCQHKPAGQSM